MDTLAHALSGALYGRITAPRQPDPQSVPTGRRMALGAFATIVPDIDSVTAYVSQVFYLEQHRGITHSLLLLPLWALLLSWACSRIWRNGPGWRAYFGLFAGALALHIAGDLITSFGTMIFAPFSSNRYGLGTTFIIDLWFSGILALALAASYAFRRSRVPAALGFAVLAGYIGFQYHQQQEAVRFGVDYARQAGIAYTRVSAQPRPVSPFHWMVVVEEEARQHYTLVSLSRQVPPAPLTPESGFFERLSAPYMPVAQAIWLAETRFGTTPDQIAFAREAYGQPAFGFFRWFALYPALFKLDREAAESCAWFHDLRFFTPGRDRWMFRFGMCRDASGQWSLRSYAGESVPPR